MLRDSLLDMANARNFFGTAAARVPSLSIDQIKAGSPANANHPFVLIQITTSVVAGGGAANVTFSLETHTADDFAAARTVLWTSPAIAKATLVAGYVVAKIPLPRSLLRYINVVAVTDTNDSTAGAMDATLVMTPQLP
jgi:hypothetical protein